MAEQLSSLEPAYDELLSILQIEDSKIKRTEQGVFRRHYITEHSLTEYGWLLLAASHDLFDCKHMEQRLAEIVYDR